MRIKIILLVLIVSLLVVFVAMNTTVFEDHSFVFEIGNSDNTIPVQSFIHVRIAGCLPLGICSMFYDLASCGVDCPFEDFFGRGSFLTDLFYGLTDIVKLINRSL